MEIEIEYEMFSCSDGHDIIRYLSNTSCPLCKALEEVKSLKAKLKECNTIFKDCEKLVLKAQDELKILMEMKEDVE